MKFASEPRLACLIAELDFANGGILPYVLSSLLEASTDAQDRENCLISA
ncbi:hypothetical protein CXB40_18875 [Pseudomonas syringae pv. avii]|nr:hypothetical protein CXB40_18875 [Pseudomonas syringae pv. avii]